MAASSVNYIVAYKNHSQIYGSASKEVALKSRPPTGFDIKDKYVWFITCPPDEGVLRAYALSREEIETAELEEEKKKKKAKKDE